MDYNANITPGDFLIVYFVDSQDVTFKQFVIDTGIFYLKPLNPQYPTILVDRHKHQPIAIFRYCISGKTGTDKKISSELNPIFWEKYSLIHT